MDWIELLYSDTIPWLMERSDPSVRYWTLTRLLDRAKNEAEVVEARRVILEEGPAATILAHYTSDGRWGTEHTYYTPKYKSAHWQLLLLAEMGTLGDDERIAAGCRRMIEELGSVNRTTIWPCFHGNLVGYLHALGHADDERVRDFEEELARAGVEGKWCCDINGDLPCAWGVARALWGFGQMEPAGRGDAVQEAIESGVRFLGRFKLREGNYPTNSSRHKLWDTLSFPLFYQSDVLHTLRALADVGKLNAKPTFRKAVEWLWNQKRDDDRWNGKSPYGSRMWTQLEQKRRPSKWITWQALYVVKAAGF